MAALNTTPFDLDVYLSRIAKTDHVLTFGPALDVFLRARDGHRMLTFEQAVDAAVDAAAGTTKAVVRVAPPVDD